MKRNSISFKLIFRQNLSNSCSSVDDYFKVVKTIDYTQDEFFRQYNNSTIPKQGQKVKIKEPHPNSAHFQNYIEMLKYQRRKGSFLQFYLRAVDYIFVKRLSIIILLSILILLLFYLKCIRSTCFDPQAFFLIDYRFDTNRYISSIRYFFKKF